MAIRFFVQVKDLTVGLLIFLVVFVEFFCGCGGVFNVDHGASQLNKC